MSSAHAASSDSALPRRAHLSEPKGEESASSEETDDDDDGDYGVQVDVLPNEYGYEVRRGVELRSGVRSRKPPR